MQEKMKMNSLIKVMVPIAAIVGGVITSIYASGFAIWAWICVILSILCTNTN